MPAPRFPAFCGAAPRGAEDGVGCACRTGKRATSEQSPLCSDVFFAFGRLHLSQKSRRRTAPLLLFFRKRPRSARLFACKRSHNGSLSLPAFRAPPRLAARGMGRGARAAPENTPRRSKLCIACSGFFHFYSKIRSALTPLLLLFRKRPRSARLFACKRAHNGSLSLPAFLRLPRLAARKDRPGHGAPEEAASHFQLPTNGD